MRLSANPDDPGYAAWGEILSSGKSVRVFLNGIERSGVMTADETERFIVMAKRDERGEIVFDRQREEFVLETLRGDVHVEVIDIGDA